MYKYKIAICGKAKSGKNTVAKMLKKQLSKIEPISCNYIAFADPVKSIARTMFPNIPEKYLTGSSEFRSSIIPGAFKNGEPLTVRQLLIDIGTSLGRGYDHDIWLKVFDYNLSKLENKHHNMVILTDCRFLNEHKHVKNKGFFNLKIVRNDSYKINHISETEQDGIPDSEFDYIIHNNGSLQQLKLEVEKVVNKLTSYYL
jgi:hypothetical protein